MHACMHAWHVCIEADHVQLSVLTRSQQLPSLWSLCHSWSCICSVSYLVYQVRLLVNHLPSLQVRLKVRLKQNLCLGKKMSPG